MLKLSSQQQIAAAVNLTRKLIGTNYVSMASVDYVTNTTTVNGTTYNVANFHPCGKRANLVRRVIVSVA